MLFARLLALSIVILSAALMILSSGVRMLGVILNAEVVLYDGPGTQASTRAIYVTDLGHNMTLPLIDNLERLPQAEFALSPDGAQLAYATYTAADNRRIFILDLHTNTTRQFSPDGVLDFLPGWSADSTRLYFQSLRMPESQAFQWWICHQDIVGGERDCQEQDLYTGDQVAWSPDGLRVAFTSIERINEEIMVMDASGENLRNISLDGGSHDWTPVWSPDGTHLAYISCLPSERLPFGYCRIILTDVQGEQKITLTDYTWGVRNLRWSPDGAQIAWIGGDNNQIYVTDISTSSTRSLSTGGDHTAAWSPNGDLLMFMSNRTTLTANIYVLDAVSGERDLRCITCIMAGQFNSPAWLP